jgi:putative oxidoreductase
VLRNSKGVAGVVGRIMLCAVFVAAALGFTVPNASNLAQMLSSKGTLGSAFAFVVAVAVLAVGCLSVIIGYRARIGALLLLVFLALATYCFHGIGFWTLVSAQARQDQIVYLMTNLSLMGAMLFIIANGAGQMSLDAKRR